MSVCMESWTEFRLPIYEHLYTYLDRRIGSDPLAPDLFFITSDGAQISGHRVVLAYCPCPYLGTLIRTKKDNYPLDVSSGALKAILLFIYKGELDETLNAETMSSLISATSSSKFDIPLLVEGYFQLLMTKRDWYSIYNDADLDPVHLGIFFDHLKAEQPKFYESSEFNNLSFDQVRKMCEPPKRPFSTKEEMTLALFQWAAFNKAGNLFSRIKEIVDLWEDSPPLILQNGVRAVVKTEPGSSNPASIQAPTSSQSVQDHERSNNSEDGETPDENISPIRIPVRRRRLPNKRTFSNVIVIDSSDESDSGTPQNPPETKSKAGPSTRSGTTPKKARKGRVNGSPDLTFDNALLLYFGKWENGDAFLSYSLKTQDTEKVAPIPLPGLHDMALLSAHDKIYCLGGTVGTYVQDIVRSLPLETLGQPRAKWYSETKLMGDRRYFQAQFYLNSIYIFGGCDGEFTLNCIDNFENRKWKCLDKYMEFLRERYGSAWLNNKLILAGGLGLQCEINEGDPEILDSVEAFDPLIGDCEILPSMNQKRKDLQLVTLDGKLYAIGGIGESKKTLKSMEIYNPDEEEWVVGRSMNHPRARGTAFALDGKIYYVGGSSELTIEVYDPVEEVWTMVESDIVEGADFSTAVIIPN